MLVYLSSFYIKYTKPSEKKPGGADGAQDTDRAPTGCASGILFTSQLPSAFNSWTETTPSEEAAANTSPISGGPKATLLIELAWHFSGVT